MKTLKFSINDIPFLLSGEKTSTWRLFDDKDLSLGDKLEFTNSLNNEVLGHGEIISLKGKKVKDMNSDDFVGHEKFDSIEEIIKNLRKYYGDVVDENSIVKIIHFSFKKI